MTVTHTRKDDIHGYFKFTHGPMPMGSSKFLETVCLACAKRHMLQYFTRRRHLRAYTVRHLIGNQCVHIDNRSLYSQGLNTAFSSRYDSPHRATDDITV